VRKGFCLVSDCTARRERKIRVKRVCWVNHWGRFEKD